MIKCKVTKKSGNSYITIKSQKGQQLCEREVYAINNNEVKSLLGINVIPKDSYFKLIYDITGLITLADYLHLTLNKKVFARILQDVLATLKSLQESFFNQKYLLMDLEHVLVSPATQQIYFVYVPIQEFESDISLREFLLSIIQYASFDSREDTSYVKDYIMILNNGVNFSIFELEEYIVKLLGQRSNEHSDTTECPQCHKSLSTGTSYCKFCGMKIYRNSVSTSMGTYDPSEYYEDLETSNYPYLIRKKTEEKIVIDKPSFRIGKDKLNSDYSISDNNAVSRTHADIITRDNRYFIVDLHSTNKTFVDGQVIPVNKEIEIFTETKLRLADEDFIFYIEP